MGEYVFARMILSFCVEEIQVQVPVVRSIVSLTSSLKRQQCKSFSHFFSTKNVGEFQILTFEILTTH